ncbi:hypothetical protein [Micavibrio aeruginosavorus]|uniref:Uncharacterized protein n=1 Tax=Micavibrio aeruginosavorus (strain ARL-13) TaxID=856793 RepID=G2KMY9_MICAA|nr:hypothetical protein [Micavibrio aeruginosavorus]AEP08921.1 hypothetical protein MICA_584 [Micavibrio aeruginosavorus ARL-13]
MSIKPRTALIADLEALQAKPAFAGRDIVGKADNFQNDFQLHCYVERCRKEVATDQSKPDLYTDLKALDLQLKKLMEVHATEIAGTVHYSRHGISTTAFKLQSHLDGVADHLFDALDTYREANRNHGAEEEAERAEARQAELDRSHFHSITG